MNNISIKDIFNIQINGEDDDIKISMSGLLDMPLNNAMDAVRILDKYPHAILCDMTPEIRDIMDLANRFPKTKKSWRANSPCQNYKCEFYLGARNPNPENNCTYEYLQEKCVDYKDY